MLVIAMALLITSIDDYRWKSHCNGLYELPVAA
jgi:hypothetical protein